LNQETLHGHILISQIAEERQGYSLFVLQSSDQMLFRGHTPLFLPSATKHETRFQEIFIQKEKQS